MALPSTQCLCPCPPRPTLEAAWIAPPPPLQVGGMLVTALLLSLVSDAIGSKVDELRKGKAAVLESGHTLIIG